MSARLLKANISPHFPQPGHAPTAMNILSPGPSTAALEVIRFDFSNSRKRRGLDIPSTERLLTDGGDARIVCGPNGCNQYGCTPQPDREVVAYGSSTASTISAAGFAAADAVRNRLNSAAITESPAVTYEREMDRVRGELKSLCGLEEMTDLEIVFGASGTDLHLFASQLMVDTSAPCPLIVRVEAAETGRGVPDALAGRHFSDCAALGDAVLPNAPLDCGRPLEILEVKCRTAEGELRAAAEVDAEVARAVGRAAVMGRRVLLTVVDVSKTGLLAPSPACVDALRRRFPDLIDVLVDACQFRMAPSTLKAYLEHDFMVAITGSKFVTGPTFCGALLVPGRVTPRFKTRTLPRALKAYSARADWPRQWSARIALKPVANFGLLLRWEAALAELRAFHDLPEATVAEFLETFAEAITRYLSGNPAFELLSAPGLDRSPVAPADQWDRFSTIFSFLLLRPKSGARTWLNQGETKKVHELLRASRCQVGQPVACGSREGVPVSALRLCISTRLIVDALSREGRGVRAVIAEALAVLEKTALLASLPRA